MEMNNDILTPDLPIPELVEFEDAPIPAPLSKKKSLPKLPRLAADTKRMPRY